MKRNELLEHCGGGDVQVTVVLHDGARRVDILGAFLSDTDADQAALDFAKAEGFSTVEDYNERSGHTLDLKHVPIQ